MSDIILFAHATFGVLGILASVWVLVEALNASEINRGRTYYVSLVAASCMVLALLLGGYWYVTYYAAEKAIILKGPWPFAHNLVMETKEHLFFVPLVLALYLPILTRVNLSAHHAARTMVVTVATLVVLSGLAIEGEGAVINYGVKVAFVHTGVKGVER
jgi:hypothetical protein